MCAARPRRLPGFRFEAQAHPLTEVLPRMDVAVFVGFAASGPLQTPVAIESEAQFKAVFGEDAPLAWNVERGEQLYAYLGPSVRAFFRNNGQRCWVIRVAREKIGNDANPNYARYNFFPIPGLLRAEFDQNGNPRISPAFARARSEGSWSDRLQVASALNSTPARSDGPLERFGEAYSIRLRRDSSDNLRPGDLLKLNFEGGRFVFLAAEDVRTMGASPPSSRTSTFEVSATKAAWFESLPDTDIPSSSTTVEVGLFTSESEASPPNAELTGSWFGNPHHGRLSSDKETFGGRVRLELSDCAPADAPLPGSMVRIELANQSWWMMVSALTAAPGSSGEPVIFGGPFRAIAPPNPLPGGSPACQRLNFEIWVRKEEEYAVSLSELGFAAAHERFWANLPTDKEVYRDADPAATTAPATVVWTQVGDLFRFPLAGIRKDPEMYFPLSMTALPENYLGAVKLNGTPLERDGLAQFSEELFIDRDLGEATTGVLAGEAEYLMYLAPQTRRLTGMHGAFALEEATIISVPDAVHRGWTREELQELPQPRPSPPPVRPEWWHFLNCVPAIEKRAALKECVQKAAPPKLKGVHEPEWGHFLNCSIRIIEPPPLSASTNFSIDGTFTLSWASSPPSPGRFVLEEAGADDFAAAETIYQGQLTSFTIYGRKPGDYFYRVRAFSEGQSSDWSVTVVVRVGTATRWSLNTEKDYSSGVLLAVQRALLRMCAARGDLVCLLSLPAHYREDDAIEHVRILKSASDLGPATGGVSPLSDGEGNDFTYGASFHPWLVERDEGQANGLIRMPPCGAVSGLFADRALRRGAWIAPANQPLRGVVALEPPIDPARRLDLQEAHINLVRQEPRGFVVLDAETLSDDPELRQTNVRRLLILLRRQALRLGANYVFEPNDAAFRRRVDRGFTEMLDGMFERGAFAGATPATAYQVVTDDSLNTPQSVDQGRFIVELRVAPSLPMTFLTIRLIQTSERSLATEVR